MLLTRRCRRLFHYSNLHHLKGTKQKNSVKQEPPELQEPKPQHEAHLCTLQGTGPAVRVVHESSKSQASPGNVQPSSASSQPSPDPHKGQHSPCRAVTELPSPTAPSDGNNSEEKGSETSLQHCSDAPADHRHAAPTAQQQLLRAQHSWGLLGNHRSNEAQFLLRVIHSLNKESVQQRR